MSGQPGAQQLPISPMEVTELYWIRHGEVDEKYHFKFGGTIDMDLSPEGARQAELTAEYLRKVGVDRLYCSPMKRARQTLAPILERSASVMERDIQPVFLDEIREIDFGIWTGKSWKQVYEDHGVSHNWMEALESGSAENAEKISDFKKRISDGIQRIIRESHGKTAIIVCHGGVIRMALHVLMEAHGLSVRAMAGIEVEYASITRVHVTEVNNTIELLNFTPWRDLR